MRGKGGSRCQRCGDRGRVKIRDEGRGRAGRHEESSKMKENKHMAGLRAAPGDSREEGERQE